jgi:hypothetical protein
MNCNSRWIVVVWLIGLGAGLALAQAKKQSGGGTGNQAACDQIRKACRGAGFTPGADLRKNCLEPILQGQVRSGLPQVDPAIVAGCGGSSSSSPSAVAPDIAVSGAGSGSVRVQPSASGGTAVPNPDGLMMSQPQPLFTGPKLGMHDMPDQQTSILQQPDGGYELFVTGVLAGQPGGVVSIFTTSDLTQASKYQSKGLILQPPQKKKSAGACSSTANNDACADYVGMEAVFTGGASGKLVGFYIADQQQFSSTLCPLGAFYGQLMVTTGPADGGSWSAGTPTLRAAPIPTGCPPKGEKGALAFNQPTVIKIGNEYYVYFAFPIPSSSNRTGSYVGIAVARAPVGAGGLPGSWQVLSGGNWTPVPTVPAPPAPNGVQTISSADIVIPLQKYVTMPWVSYNNYLQAYLMTMITQDGFYYSKLAKSDVATQHWMTPPQKFESISGPNWGSCAETWENMSFVTPGLPDNHTTGKSGYVILSVVPGWACKTKGARSFDIASYSFGVTSPPQPPVPSPTPPPRPTPKPPPCPSAQPCRQ